MMGLSNNGADRVEDGEQFLDTVFPFFDKPGRIS